ncbi:amino acid adenylation domain-containing protein [Enterococcus faecium]
MIEVSAGQKQIWAYHKYNSGTMYNVPYVIKINQEIDIDKFREVYKKIVDRHEILRTNFIEKSNNVYQIVNKEYEPYFKYIDISSKKDKLKLLKEYANEEYSYRFNLEEDSLIRLSLVKIKSNEYYVVCIQNHIITDGWSINILKNEFKSLYNNLNINESKFQYVDYLINTKEKTYNEQIEFWKKELEGDLPILKVPESKERPKIMKYTGDSISKYMNKKLFDKIKDVSKISKTSEFNLLLSSYISFLQRYLNQEEVIVGIPVTKRDAEYMENIVGYFVNVLPIRFKYNGDSTIIDLGQEVQYKVLKAIDNRNVDIEYIAESLKISRTSNINPIYQTVFSLEIVDENDISREILNSNYSNCDLVLQVLLKGEDIELKLEYSNEIYDKKSMIELLDNFVYWLENIFKDCKKFDHVEVVSEEEIEKQIFKWNNTVDKTKFKNVNDLLCKFINIENFNTSVVDDRRISYSQLDDLSNCVANCIINKKINPQTIIAVNMDRSIEYIVAILGILKAGCIFLPIDTNMPENRIVKIINDAGVEYLINRSTEYNILCKNILNFEEMLKYSNAPIRREVCEDDDAYIIYTSGSTGIPKGVRINHRGLCNFIISLSKKLKLNSKSKGLQMASISFDASIWEIFLILANGGELYIYDDKYYGENLVEFINDNKISHCIITPMLYSTLDFNSTESLKYIVTGGSEYIKNTTVPDDIKIINAYGPTEATICSSIYEVNNKNDSVVPIGKPIDNVKILILGESNKLLPVGIPGEIYIGGINVSPGYINNEELNSTVFIKNPYSNDIESIYKTGDIGKYLSDGNIVYCGRKDNQVKIRGFRIELGEIEKFTKGLEEVDNCIVVNKNKGMNNTLNLYYSGRISIEDLKISLQNNLPYYMIPNKILKIKEFPLNSSGKVDKSALEKLDYIDVSKYKQPNEEISTNESILIDILKKILGENEIQTSDNFFELGGDSITAIKFVSAARDRGINIRTSDVFEFQSVRNISKNISTETSKKEIYKIKKNSKLAPIQEWFFKQNFPNKNHWNQSMAWEINENIDIKIVKKVIEHIYSIHDNFKVSFNIVNKNWSCNVINENKNIFVFEDLSHCKDFDTRVLEIENHLQRSLKIDEGILSAISIIKIEENKYRLFWCIHHLIVDGVSWRILTDELIKYYIEFKNNKKISQKAINSYQEWVYSLDAYKENINTKIIDYWIEVEKDLNLQSYGLDKSLSLNKNDKIIYKIFDVETTERFISKIKKYHSYKVEIVLLSIFIEVICDIVRKDEIYILMEGHGREDFEKNIDTSNTTGWFTSMYPVKLKKTGNINLTIKKTDIIMKNIPNKGFDYQFIKKNNSLKDMISFNYLGMFNNSNEINYLKTVTSKSDNVSKDNNNVNILDCVFSIEDSQLKLYLFNSKDYEIDLLEISNQIENKMLFYCNNKIDCNVSKSLLDEKFDEIIDLINE